MRGRKRKRRKPYEKMCERKKKKKKGIRREVV